MHQHLIDRQAMEPCGEGRFAAKRAYFAKELDKDFLSEVFGLRDVLRHSQAQAIDPAIMARVEFFVRSHIAPGGGLGQRIICLRGDLRLLGVGASDVLPDGVDGGVCGHAAKYCKIGATPEIAKYASKTGLKSLSKRPLDHIGLP
jgi:hypothetical protein